MTSAFRKSAKLYDQQFTNSIIGKRQRKMVHNYLNNFLEHNYIKSALEINCGTGEDAIFLAKKGIDVFATDISPEMIEVAKSKVSDIPNLTFEIADIKNIENADHYTDYHLVFSNFGGLNCLNNNELSQFLENIQKILKPQSHIIMVLMPVKSTIDKWYHTIFKNRSNYADLKRSAKGMDVNVNGDTIKTWYYNFQTIKSLNNDFDVQAFFPIGFFPSYLNKKINRFKGIGNVLLKTENFFLKFKRLANYADHYLIHLKLK